MSYITTLKEMNLDRILDLEEAVALSHFGERAGTGVFGTGPGRAGVAGISLGTLRAEIAQRVKAQKTIELRKLDAEIEGYKTVSEKKTEALRRRGKLIKELGVPSGV